MADAIPETLPCVHCEAPVEPDHVGDWIHTGPDGRGRLYRCQSDGVEYGHLAHPAGTPCRADGPNPCLGASVADYSPDEVLDRGAAS